MEFLLSLKFLHGINYDDRQHIVTAAAVSMLILMLYPELKDISI
jgi:hypothetical protein